MSAPSTSHSGIPIVGEIPFGTHFCQFYRTRQDLVDTLVPYFATGLRNNELCLWVTSEPFDADEATAAMHVAMPDFADFLDRGQIEICSYQDWYLRTGKTGGRPSKGGSTGRGTLWSTASPVCVSPATPSGWSRAPGTSSSPMRRR